MTAMLDLEPIERAIKQIEALEETSKAKWYATSYHYLYCLKEDGSGTNDGTTGKEAWYQGVWRQVTHCGTAMCLAGWIADMNGGIWIEDSSYLVPTEEERAKAPQMDTIPGTAPIFTAPADRVVNITGIDWAEADYLFSPDRTLQNMKDWLEEKQANPDKIIRSTEMVRR
jgi:hypothetical protein